MLPSPRRTFHKNPEVNVRFVRAFRGVVVSLRVRSAVAECDEPLPIDC